MRVMNSPRQRAHELRDRDGIHGDAVQVVREVGTIHKAHAQERPPIQFPELINRHDIGVVQPGGGFRFGFESFQLWFPGELPGEQHFQCDDSIQARVMRAINDTHTSVRNLLKQFEAPQSPN